MIEVLSPRDESFVKLPFYAEMGVADVLVVEPSDVTHWLYRLDGGSYVPVSDGRLASLGAHVSRTEDGDGPLRRFAWADGTHADIRPWSPPR